MKQFVPLKTISDQMECLDKVIVAGTASINAHPAATFRNWYDCHSKLTVSDLVGSAFEADTPLLHIAQSPAVSIASRWNDVSVKLTEGFSVNGLKDFFTAERSSFWDTHWTKLKVFDDSLRDIDETVEVLRNLSDKHDSNSRVQAVTEALNLNRKKLKGHYFTILHQLKRHLSADEFNKLKRVLSSQMEAIQNLFSRLRGKIKSVARSLSCANLLLDRRVEHRKKLKVILKQNDDEDHIL